MHPSLPFIASLLLASAGSVLGGGRLWETKAPNKRTNPTPEYPRIEALNVTSPLVRRAVSIMEQPDDNDQARIWPNKKIRYCFDNEPTTVFKGLWEQGINSWALLKDHGFSYEEVTDRNVCNSQRSSILRIYYNSNGRLDSTVGVPPVDQEDNQGDSEDAIIGPYTHLSDLEDAGTGNVVANIAHEIGHIWGLWHQHQFPYYWKVSTGDDSKGYFVPSLNNVKNYFQTKDFNCQNLQDYDSAHARVQKKIDDAIKANDGEKQGDLESDLRRLCTFQPAAQKHGFSASEWLPMSHTRNMERDPDYDPESIMNYHSSSGGLRTPEGRAVVMVYEDGTHLPVRLSPSAMDINRLLTLYGNEPSSTPPQLHNSKSSSSKNKFSGIRKFFSLRAGDTKNRGCN